MRKCPNCAAHPVADHPANGCVLAALIQCIRDRGTVPERRLRDVHAHTDVDALWNDVGKIVDRLEEGAYR